MGRQTFRAFGSTAAAVAGGAIRDDGSCFADEVVIDFPSVAPAVDRIRSAFLADERVAALSAAIQLSPREAMAGATVPLEVPVRLTCQSCGGRGETWTEPCARCAGSIPGPRSSWSSAPTPSPRWGPGTRRRWWRPRPRWW